MAEAGIFVSEQARQTRVIERRNNSLHPTPEVCREVHVGEELDRHPPAEKTRRVTDFWATDRAEVR
ncbi:hypothetical protein C0995_014716 [Termitomyces sp. Mi166|nr:hypothetical protein C0995_014716 [Termitomyces sp. Mi166\